MRKHNDNDANHFDFVTQLAANRLDPLSAEVMAQNARQIEMALFLLNTVEEIGDGIKKVIAGIAAWYRSAQLSRELHAMPDYILKDIGISRDQIDAVATGKLVRETTQPRPANVQPAEAVTDDNDVDRPLAA
jgi:uncharacterized protein YjiS (DUF1127 family)